MSTAATTLPARHAIPLIPNEVKKSFFAHVLKSSDQDKVERSRRAFGRM
jgi:hypothetical protein